MKDSLLSIAKNEASAKIVSAKTQCSVQRIKTSFRIIAKRKASNQRARELWYAGCMR